MWVIVAGMLVMFMQAGFAFLEIGFSRGKNVGTVIAKILVNFSIAAIMFWAVGFAFAFGEGNEIIGTTASSWPTATRHATSRSSACRTRRSPSRRCGSSSSSSAPCRWRSSGARRSSGSSSASTSSTRSSSRRSSTRSARTGSSAAAGCSETFGMQDFAGSTVVHLIGATGAFAALLLLGRAAASTAPTASRGRSRATPCRCSASAC